jgi:hypothetical protein
MKRVQSSLFLFLLLLIIPSCVHAQAWSGIIDPSRAVDWSRAGVPGGVPNRTTQCGPTIAAYGTSSNPGSATTINKAIAACPAGQFVSLGAGTFYIDADIMNALPYTSNVTLRGQGANSTFIIFSPGTSGNCQGMGAAICLTGSNNSANNEDNVCDWIAGYSVGANVITLANCGSTTPAIGALGGLHVGSVITLDQLDEATDTGTIWNCAVTNVCATANQGGGARTDGTCSGGTCIRSQQQQMTVTGISGSNVSISPGVYMPNWRSGQKPQAWFANTTVTGVGVENLSIDNTNSGEGHGIVLLNCNQCWVKGVRSLVANRSHVELAVCSHCVVRDSYFYQNVNHSSVSYGIELGSTSDSLIENNISQQVTDSAPSCTGACEGNVMAYNLGIDSTYTSPGWFQASYYQHSSGDALNLWEGNIGTGYSADSVHGTHQFETLFRNYFIGTQAAGCDGVACNSQTVPIHLFAGSRYFNIVGNVLGQSGYHAHYQCNAFSIASCSVSGATVIFNTGYTGGDGTPNPSIPHYCTSISCSAFSYYDPQVTNYLMRWANYDVVNASTQFNSAEVPTTLASFSNGVPASQILPTSFYLSAKPMWWGSLPYPAIGPDVSAGNVGNCTSGSLATFAPALATSSSQCGGGSFTASVVGGHANTNPAMNCYLNVMGGPADGTGSALTFNASTCYGKSGSATLPQAPTGVSAAIGN